MNCLPLHLSIGPCIDSGSVDVGMAQKLREKDKRHTGTIQTVEEKDIRNMVLIVLTLQTIL